MDKWFSTDVRLKRLTDEGSVEALFSVSSIVDSDGDRVLPTAFRDGQHVGMVWSHDWQKIVGRGEISVRPNGAAFIGKFFTDTRDGLDAYRTVKAMSAPPSIQGWSFGFRTLKAERGAGGENVITDLDLFEVSPCLIGANRATSTLAIKAGAAGTAARRPDPALAAMRSRFYANLSAQDRAAKAEARAILLRSEATRIREQAAAATVAASITRTLTNADRILSGRR